MVLEFYMPTGSLNAALSRTELWALAGKRLRQPYSSHSALSDFLLNSWLQEMSYQVHVCQLCEGFGVWPLTSSTLAEV